jgi:hypothetical protein
MDWKIITSGDLILRSRGWSMRDRGAREGQGKADGEDPNRGEDKRERKRGLGWGDEKKMLAVPDVNVVEMKMQEVDLFKEIEDLEEMDESHEVDEDRTRSRNQSEDLKRETGDDIKLESVAVAIVIEIPESICFVFVACLTW